MDDVVLTEILTNGGGIAVLWYFLQRALKSIDGLGPQIKEAVREVAEEHSKAIESMTFQSPYLTPSREPTRR